MEDTTGMERVLQKYKTTTSDLLYQVIALGSRVEELTEALMRAEAKLADYESDNTVEE